MSRQITRLVVALVAFALGVSASALWSSVTSRKDALVTEKHLPETIGGYPVLTFEGPLLQYSPHMGAGCGVLYIHQVAKYRVDKIVQGEYGGHEIVVDHPACDENVFKDIPLGSRVRLVVSLRQSYNVVTIFPGIREHENPSSFYIAETEPMIIGAN